MWPFRTTSGLEIDDEEWQLETWAWLLRSLGGLDDLRESALILPTRDFFPPSEAQGHERAQAVFDTVKSLARMQEWNCSLIAQPDRGDGRLGPVTALKRTKSSALGTFSTDGNSVVISYEPQLIKDPWGLVATLAHELAHYLLAGVVEEPPGGHANHEFATDLATVYLGFGVFNANAAVRFKQFTSFDSQGWRYQRAGYLSEKEWSFALAVFLTLRGEDPKVALSYLKPSIQTDIKRSLRYLARHSDKVEGLKATKPVQPARAEDGEHAG